MNWERQFKVSRSESSEDLGRITFSLELFTTPGAPGSLKNCLERLEKLYWSRTGGSIHRTICNIFCEKWVFSLKMYQFVREIWVAADSQRRRNNILFPRSEAEGKYGLFRSQQRRLRLVAVAATRQQQCNLPSLQPAASHLD